MDAGSSSLQKSVQQYFSSIEQEVKRAYDAAAKARAQGRDPEPKIDIPVAEDLAARVEGLVGTVFPQLINSGLKDGIRALEKKWGKNDERVALEIAQQITGGQFVEFDNQEEAFETGVRVGTAYLTLGVVTAPLEGITSLKIVDGYAAIFYAGPIRSAGGTAEAMSVLLTDYLRRQLGIQPFKANKIEIKRYITEVADYNRLHNLQYMPSEEEIALIIENVPVCLDGDPTEEKEVSTYKDLSRVGTNRIRGGMCLVLGEGIASKAPKILSKIKKFGKDFDFSNWLWLEDLVKLQKARQAAKKQETEKTINSHSVHMTLGYAPSEKYVAKVIAGRPVLAHPARPGGFRLRYGRARTGGLAATAIHSAAAQLLEFTAIGTQLATELPGKATICTVCESIEPPVVKLKDGTVLELKTKADVLTHKNDVEQILFLGDVLIPFGEFVSNGHLLMPPSWVEEWWALEAKEKIEQKKLSEELKGVSKYSKYLDKPYPTPPFELAWKISKELDVPLHPSYNFFWHDIDEEELKQLVEWFSKAKIENEKAILPLDGRKALLETLCVPHIVEDEKIVLESAKAPLFQILGQPSEKTRQKLFEMIDRAGDIMQAISSLAGIPIREKGIVRVGMKMGRPEKAERRLMEGRPQILFPCGQQGGRMRNLMTAYEKGYVVAEWPIYKCQNADCRAEGHYPLCQCGAKTEYSTYVRKTIDVKEMLDGGFKKLDIDKRPELVKGVRGVTSARRCIEPLEKGLLRAKYDLYVNKDGTTRYDATNAGLTHFKPSEIGVSAERLRELGYEFDAEGKKLEREDQLLVLKPQDIIISDNEDFSAVDYLIRAANFIDELLQRFYGLEPFYKIKTKEDLLGHLVIGLAPHTSAGIVGRIIGFTPAKVCFGHPFWHAGKRRNCIATGERVLQLNDNHPNFLPVELIKPGDAALTGDPATGLLTKAQVKKVYKNPAPDHMLQINLKSGRELLATPEHRLLVYDGKKLIEKRAFDIKKGDLLPVVAKLKSISRTKPVLDIFSALKKNKELTIKILSSEINRLICQNGGLAAASKKIGTTMKSLDNWRRRGRIPIHAFKKLGGKKIEKLGLKRRREIIPAKIIPTQSLARLLGYYMAEGYARKGSRCNQVQICTKDRFLAADIIKCCQEVFGIKPKYNGQVVILSGNLLYWFFNSYLNTGKNAHEKKIPSFVFDLDEKLIGDFLAAYFSGDGSIDKSINCCSVNRNLLEQIQLLLLRLDIFPHWQVEEKLITTGKVAAFYKRKKKLLKSKLYYLKVYSRDIRKFAEKISFIHPAKKRKLHKLLATTKISQRHKIFKRFGDFYLVPVMAISPIKTSSQIVYDIECEKNHTFICNGLLSHNCDGDEDSKMLLLDALLNFSRQFLPDKRGGRSMDAPLVLTTKLDPQEVDNEAWNIDIESAYPLEFYRETWSAWQDGKGKYPWELSKKIRTVADVIGASEVFAISFTHPTADIHDSPFKTKYVKLAAMEEKVAAQLELAKKIRAVDADKVAEAILEKHFLRDIKGNLRTFSSQQVRCVDCNEKYRRPPLLGKCAECGGNLVLTVAEGTIRKYVEPSKKIIESHRISPFLMQQFVLIEKDIDSIFGKKARQLALEKFAG